MVRALYLIENGSYRFDHRARREACTLCDAGLKRVKEVLSWPHQAPNLLQIYEELFPGQIEWGTYSASA